MLLNGLLGALCLTLHNGHIHRCIGCSLLVVGLLSWAMAPRRVGVLLFREARTGPAPVLVLTSDAGDAVPYADAEWRESLSLFTRDAVGLALAQPIANQPTDRGAFVMHRLPNRQGAGVVRYRRGLTTACNAELDIVVSFTAPLYLCRTGTAIVTLPTAAPQNRLIFYEGLDGWRFVPRILPE